MRLALTTTALEGGQREELKAALQARWEQSLRQRAALSPASAVPLLNRLLAGVEPAWAAPGPAAAKTSRPSVDRDAGRPDLNLRDLGKPSKEPREESAYSKLRI